MSFTESEISPELEAAVSDKAKVIEALYHPGHRKKPTEQDYEAARLLAQNLHHRLRFEESGYDKPLLEQTGKRLAEVHHQLGSDKIADQVFLARFDAVEEFGWILRSGGDGTRWETALRYVVLRDIALLMEAIYQSDGRLLSQPSMIEPSHQSIMSWLRSRNTNETEFTKQANKLINDNIKDERRRKQLKFARAFLSLSSKI